MIADTTTSPNPAAIPAHALNERYADSIIGDRAENYNGLEIQGVRDVYEGENKYMNHYHCPCGAEWSDQWSCMCNDRCPTCNKEIEPHHSDDLSPSECEVDNVNPEFFSVYVHLKDGGVECVGDFCTHALAESYAKELAATHHWPIQDFTGGVVFCR